MQEVACYVQHQSLIVLPVHMLMGVLLVVKVGHLLHLEQVVRLVLKLTVVIVMQQIVLLVVQVGMTLLPVSNATHLIPSVLNAQMLILAQLVTLATTLLQRIAGSA